MKTVKVYVRTRLIPNGHAADIVSATYPLGIKGCPMGRGHTPLTAVADLRRRVREESGIDIETVFC